MESGKEKLRKFLATLSDGELLELLTDGVITPNQARVAQAKLGPAPPPPEPTTAMKGGFPRPFWSK